MGTARQDYERFVRWLHEPDRNAPESVRRIANLVLANFDAIAETSRQRNNRSNRMAELARAQLATTDAGLPALPEAPAPGTWPFTRLSGLTLGPFRGFRMAEDFDLDKQIVLCYGPNGSGKSSLCEALEFALLGAVEEAEAKRVPQADYLRNLHAGAFAAPVLTGRDPEGRTVAVVSNADAFRFCFVEKNRIDAFSRIAARPIGKRAELVAALFGMDQFNEFVGHFNESMDPSLNLGMRSQELLAASRASIDTDRDTADNEAQDLDALLQSASKYAAGLGLTLEALRPMLGTPDTPGRLQELESAINEVPPAATGLTRERLSDLYTDIDGAQDAAKAFLEQLKEKREQLSFRDLYRSVTDLRAVSEDRCPACDTPIANTASNPFTKAAEGLQQLEQLAELEAAHDVHERALETASQALREQLLQLQRFLESEGLGDGVPAAYLRSIAERPDPGSEWWNEVRTAELDEKGATPSLKQLLDACDRARAQDERSNAAREQRAVAIEERDRLNEARLWIAANDLQRSQVVDGARKARERILQWEDDNRELIDNAKTEVEENLRDRPISEAYDQFLLRLHQFRAQLPGMLMTNLNQTAMELYNEFNRNDRNEDLLASLRLPLGGEERIELAFRGNPDRWVDALTALSEGHIRCLGLAILMAKALDVRAPVIVFDDAINAIDHDHRSGIRAAIFESERFRDTQLIVTCHSPEFIKDVQNNLMPPRLRDSKSYALAHHDGNYQPRVNSNPPPQNYLVRANAAMAAFDPRDALSHCRKALEMLSRKTWKWLDSHRVGLMSVPIEGPDKEPQLRALCEALLAKLRNSPNFQHANKAALTQRFGEILGIPQNNLIWTLLNKGTHEEPDRDDFDRDLVQQVIDALEGINALDLRPGR